MKASKLTHETDFPHLPELKKINLQKVDASLVSTLENFRVTTGIPMIPSPLQGGWWRETGSETSRHYAVDRLSDAGDLFPEKGRILEVLFCALQYPDFGGVGVYVDTNGPDGSSWPMIHVDLRPRESGLQTAWARDGDYHYPHQREFWSIIGGLC